ncbi:hypothetical protein DFH06DRAFT_1484800 [Mycena polygramma]|nr:hypothetical protein DFH06DRAFT_1484800 [Mycena polygramma]
MPRLRILRSSSGNEWLSPLLVVAKGLVTISNAVPFPYVNAALASELALLELIQMVDKSNDDLRYLAESVLTIMRLLHEETEAHPTDQRSKFRGFCGAFERDLTRLAKDLESIRKQQCASRFKKYFNAHNMRDEISHFTRQVDDLRANATLTAAIGTRVTVETGVAAVEDRVARLEHHIKDFHALKLADIHLEFNSARAGPFTGDPQRHDERALFGFCDSPRLTSLVFHGEFCTLDEYANRLPSPRAIVDWELSLISDIAELHGAGFTWSAIFALVNTFIVSFIVPLRRKLSRDANGDCGYFLKTATWFGSSLPDGITCSWLAQAKSILSKSSFPQGDPSEYVIPHFPCLQLNWEMITVAQDGSSRAVDLPDCVHAFVQVPLLAGARIDEHRVYWSTQPNATQTGDIPAAALEIRMSWNINFSLLRWETHHYEGADRVQEECEFDPTTNAAAQSLDLPLLSVVTDQNTANVRPRPADSWCRYFVRDPHTMEEIEPNDILSRRMQFQSPSHRLLLTMQGFKYILAALILAVIPSVVSSPLAIVPKCTTNDIDCRAVVQEVARCTTHDIDC